jgi:DNA-binding response OmpR family regulator
MNHDADYCPHCHRPVELTPAPVERDGLRLDLGTLSYGSRSVHLTRSEAEFMRILMQDSLCRASREFLLLQISPESYDTIIRVHAHSLKRKLANLTGGSIFLKTNWGWGYELVSQQMREAA